MGYILRFNLSLESHFIVVVSISSIRIDMYETSECLKQLMERFFARDNCRPC